MTEKLYGNFEDVGEELIGVLSAPDIIYEANYNLLFNRPKINGVELEGDKSWADLGLDLSDYYTKTETTEQIANEIDTYDDIVKSYLLNYYTKVEADGKFALIEDIPTDFYTKAETDEKLGAVEMTAVQALNTGSYANQRIDGLGDIYYTKAAAESFNRSISASIVDLYDKIPTQLSQLTGDTTHRVVTDEQIAEWDGKSEFDGDYNSLSNKPTIPTRVAELSDASEYAKKSEIPTDYATRDDIDTALNAPMSDVATVEGVGYDVAVSGNSAKLGMVGGRTVKQGDELVSAKVDKIESITDNLWIMTDGVDTISSGGNFTATRKNGILNIKGSTNDARFVLSPTEGVIYVAGHRYDTVLKKEYSIKLEAGTYYAYAFAHDTVDVVVRLAIGNDGDVFTSENQTDFLNLTGAKTITLDSPKLAMISLYSNRASLDYDVKIMISKKPITSWVEGKIIDTYPIPTEIQQLDGYGLSVSDEIYNYVDFERKKFVKRVASVDLGDLSWSYRGSETGGTGTFSTRDISDRAFKSNVLALCGMYSFGVVGGIVSASKLGNFTCSMFYGSDPSQKDDRTSYVRNDNYNDSASFKSAMSGVQLIYELATPEEIDISAYLPDDVFIKADGSVIYHSDSGLAVPYRMQTGVMSKLWETALDKGGSAPAPSSGGMELLFEGVTSASSPADLSNITDYHAVLISIGKGAIADSSSHVGVNLWLVADLMAFGGANSKRFDTSIYGSYSWCTFTSDKKLYSESTTYPHITVYGIK